jgi:hypothetical protein
VAVFPAPTLGDEHAGTLPTAVGRGGRCRSRGLPPSYSHITSHLPDDWPMTIGVHFPVRVTWKCEPSCLCFTVDLGKCSARSFSAEAGSLEPLLACAKCPKQTMINVPLPSGTPANSDLVLSCRAHPRRDSREHFDRFLNLVPEYDDRDAVSHLSRVP